MNKRFACAGVSVALVASVSAARPPAAIHTESPDAGQTIATAQSTSGMGLLNLIQGTISPGADVDIFCINITDPMNFTATTAIGPDTQLFLFKPDGRGVASDDDSGGGGANSFLDGRFVTSPGLYYLAISQFNNDPLDTDGFLIFPSPNFYTVPPGSDLPLGSWSGAANQTEFAYEIRLTGVDFSNCTVIPLPTSGLMGLAGLGAMASVRRRRVK